MTKKYCPHCQQTKKTTEFNRNSRNKDGLGAYCRECDRTRTKQYYVPDPDAQAFLAALDEITDEDLYNQIQAMLVAAEVALKEHGKLKDFAAKNQAVHFVSRCVYKGVTANRPLFLRPQS
jgi:hypothetical protein